MNYHIITQDKFFNGYIEDIYELQLEHDNVFWVQGNPGDQPFLTTNRPVEYLGIDKDEIIHRLKKLNPNDRLYVSWYCGIVAQAIVESGIKNPLYAYVMGGEFYADPWEWHCSWLYDKQTYAQYKKIGWIPSVKLSRKNPLHWGRIIDDVKLVREWKSQSLTEYEKKQKEIARIDYLVLPKQADGEYDLIKTLYPSLKAKHVYGLFDQNFDLASKLLTKETVSQSYKILLGNSADPTNNHIDALTFIKKEISAQVDVYSILSYGDTVGKNWAIKTGENLFGDHFYPILDYMDRQSYLDFVNSMDVVVMYHNRQQAAGNIMTALVLGKPVFMKSENVVYKMLKNIGVSAVFDIKQISKRPLNEYIKEAKEKRKETAEIIKNIYSKELRLKYLKELLTVQLKND